MVINVPGEDDLPMPKNGHMVRMLRDVLKKRVLHIPVAPASGVLGQDTDCAAAQRLRAALIRRPRNPDFGPVLGASPDLQVSRVALSGAVRTCELGLPLCGFMSVSLLDAAMPVSCTAHGHWVWRRPCTLNKEDHLKLWACNSGGAESPAAAAAAASST